MVGLFTRSDLAALLGAVPFVFSPILLERAFRHTSLAAQFFVLGALYYYVRGCREGRHAFPGLFVLNLLTITVHPYFVPMTYAVTLALVLLQAARTRRPVRAPRALKGAAGAAGPQSPPCPPLRGPSRGQRAAALPRGAHAPPAARPRSAAPCLGTTLICN